VRLEDLTTRFQRHEMSKNAVSDCDTLRSMAENLACAIVSMTPESREQSLALTKLEEAMFWAAAAISRHPKS
jgi:hypothetical protein